VSPEALIMVNIKIVVYWNMYIVPDCGMIDEWCIGMAVEGSGCGLF
jgi:hypothetical protein